MTEPLLRLRADAYYVPVADGVWIRTTDGSFRLRGRTVATWVERLAPLLDRGVAPDRLLASLPTEQAGFVRTLLSALERHGVVRREDPEAAPIPVDVERAFPQQVEFLRHLVADPGAAMTAVRACPVSVAGPVERAAPLAAILLESGFGDVSLLDAEPTAELSNLPEALGVPARVRRATRDVGAHVLGVFADGEDATALRVAETALAEGRGSWLGLTRGQAMLLKAQIPGSDAACIRCAWRRLVHAATALPCAPGLGPVPVSIAGAVLVHDLFRHVSGAVGAGRPPESEGVVVDLTRLSIWRQPVDVDPTCDLLGTAGHVGVTAPAHDEASGSAPTSDPADWGGVLAERLLSASCFGPVAACSPEDLPQLPLASARLRVNRPGRVEPAASVADVLVVGENMPDVRREAGLLSLEAVLGVARHGASVGAGRDKSEALARAIRSWAQDVELTGWADPDPAEEPEAAAAEADVRRLRELTESEDLSVRLERHPAGLWRARVGATAPVVDVAARPAIEAALLLAVARRTPPAEGEPATPLSPAVSTYSADTEALLHTLNLHCSPLAPPPSAADIVTAVEVGVATPAFGGGATAAVSEHRGAER
ncbi:hypothetical protein FHR81_005558 [Actinoalloteichus hoggarensis]|uniref:Uncharacterized protein n=1 Tax=Actinoalloteichus hoggarensis TaxID=1470176 RepID=A0A221W4H9_9PSEU|nr:hypothetical protein [Actinoalloteichus hoggarensis]ASO20674.1 hypothetical protein AHOG_15240 [Actinoalloteichus hoggarensis]MBB5924473.1 hypothetical protein [Actinoalloteichus hoggarensis]